jgi:hypothetical protein
MVLNPYNKVPLPEKGIIVQRSGANRTVSKVLRTYRNSKGQPTSDRVAIGKLDPESGMLIPNKAYFIHYPAENPETEKILYQSRMIGTAFLVDRLASSLGLDKALLKAFGKPVAGKILTAALYMVARGNSFKEIEDFCEDCVLRGPKLAYGDAIDLFESITPDERIAFFKSWLARKPAKRTDDRPAGQSAKPSGKKPPKRYLAYAVTSYTEYPDFLEYSLSGRAGKTEKLPEKRLAFYVSRESGLPAFYVTCAGPVIDSSSLPDMTALNGELGIRDVCFVTGGGFCNAENLRDMADGGLDFVTGTDAGGKETRDAMKEGRRRLYWSPLNDIGDGFSAVAMRDFCHWEGLATHVFLDARLAEDQLDGLRQEIQAKEGELSRKRRITERKARRYRGYFVIERAEDGTFTFAKDFRGLEKKARLFGFRCLLTNTGIDSREALEIHRRKFEIERGLFNLKNRADMHESRFLPEEDPEGKFLFGFRLEEDFEGKLFCAFIALILTSAIRSRLRYFLDEYPWGWGRLVSELERIRALEAPGAGRRLKEGLTGIQRKLFECFGLTENDLRNYVTRP